MDNMYNLLVYRPIRYMFINGASILGYGGNFGAESVDICSRLTGVPSIHWESNHDQCEDTIDRHVHGYGAVGVFIAYCTIVYYILAQLIRLPAAALGQLYRLVLLLLKPCLDKCAIKSPRVPPAVEVRNALGDDVQ